MLTLLSVFSLCSSLLGLTNAVPILEERQSISTLTSSQVAGYKPYSNYASAAYCQPASTLAWNCGTKCSGNPGFIPIASGGDGALIQYWYVGYDPSLKTVIVAYQGTDASKILPIVTDANFFLKPLDSTLFPGLSSSIMTHDGFGDAHERSANFVLSAVRGGLQTYSATKVTIVGHSLGGALAIISTAHLSIHLPSGTTLRTITYSNPRVGNQAFVDYVNARATMTRINNQDDIIPIVPGRFLNFAHTEGEIHIVDSNAWISCPDQDSTNSQCTIGYVPNIFAGDLGDHGGPFDGVYIGC